MTTVLEFNEKKFWITLSSIMARREAARESSPSDLELSGTADTDRRERQAGREDGLSTRAQAEGPSTRARAEGLLSFFI